MDHCTSTKWVAKSKISFEVELFSHTLAQRHTCKRVKSTSINQNVCAFCRVVVVGDPIMAKEMLAMDAFVGRAYVDVFTLFEGENIGK